MVWAWNAGKDCIPREMKWRRDSTEKIEWNLNDKEVSLVVVGEIEEQY